MMYYTSLWLLAILSFFLSNHEVLGEVTLSSEEDLEIRRQLRLINKPPTKTILDEEDGIIDCIDIYKQFAFDNPLLKNHKIQMRPSYFPQGIRSESSSTLAQLKHFECPQGTVPVPRTRKEDLIRAKHFSQLYNPKFDHQLSTDLPGQHRARIITDLSTESTLFYGVHAQINIQNPKVADDEWSSAQLYVEDGPKQEYNTIQAGWAVSRKVFGDDKTRFFTYWSSNGYDDSAGCVNTVCPGFVQVSSQLPLSAILPNISQYGGRQVDLPLLIHQDNSSNDHWWLTYLADTNNPLHIGYWPSTLVPNLKKGSHQVGWGGFTIGPKNGHSPPMGNGRFPSRDSQTSSYFANIRVVILGLNQEYTHVYPEAYGWISDVDSPQCYKVNNNGISGSDGYKTLFGGPGGECGV